MNNPKIKASPAKMAGTVGKAGMELIADVMHNKKAIVSEDIYQKRMEICHGCNHYRDDNRCSLCGCFMYIKAKLCRSNCPEGRWDSEK